MNCPNLHEYFIRVNSVNSCSSENNIHIRLICVAILGIYMELYYKKESYDIIGAAMHVYNVLGPGFVESVYQEALEMEFQKRKIPYEREKDIDLFYEGALMRVKFRPDFICYGKIIVELKAVQQLDDMNRVQVYNYLKATQYKLGWLLNFGSNDGLEMERKVL